MLVCCLFPAVLRAQRQYYAGALGGVATLSSAGQAAVTASSAAASPYSTRNGAALNLFAGLHLSNCVSLQGNYMWNRNAPILTFTASPGPHLQPKTGWGR